MGTASHRCLVMLLLLPLLLATCRHCSSQSSSRHVHEESPFNEDSGEFEQLLRKIPQEESSLLFIHQSHSGKFWQLNGDDSGTAAGELGFIFMEWSGFPTYDYITAFEVMVDSSMNPYVPCDQGDTCTDGRFENPKRVGYAPIGNLAVPTNETSSTQQVDYFLWAWFSFPKGGQCSEGQPLGYEGCGYLPPCATKTIERRCLETKEGWNDSISVGSLPVAWSIYQSAFASNDESMGGCPDVTDERIPSCNSSRSLSQTPLEVFSLKESPFITNTFVPQQVTNYSVSPLLSVNYHSNSICEIKTRELLEASCDDLIAIEGFNLTNYQPTPLTTTYNDTVFFFFKGHHRTASEGLIVGYRYLGNSIVYNFTSEVSFDWFAADEVSLVGLNTKLNPRIPTTYGEYTVQVVRLDLNTRVVSNLAPYGAYNNSEVVFTATYNYKQGMIVFEGVGNFLGLENTVLYSINAPAIPGFPIIHLATTIVNYAYSPLDDSIYVLEFLHGELTIGRLDLQLAQVEEPYFHVTSEILTTDTKLAYFDPASYSWTICCTNGYQRLLTYNVLTGALLSEYEYECELASFVYSPIAALVL